MLIEIYFFDEMLWNYTFVWYRWWLKSTIRYMYINMRLSKTHQNPKYNNFTHTILKAYFQQKIYRFSLKKTLSVVLRNTLYHTIDPYNRQKTYTAMPQVILKCAICTIFINYLVNEIVTNLFCISIWKRTVLTILCKNIAFNFTCNVFNDNKLFVYL